MMALVPARGIKRRKLRGSFAMELTKGTLFDEKRRRRRAGEGKNSKQKKEGICSDETTSLPNDEARVLF